MEHGRFHFDYICDKKFVGENALTELGAIWYRITSIHIWCTRQQNELEHVKRLAKELDRWEGTGLMINRIKNVMVDIDIVFLKELAAFTSDKQDHIELMTTGGDESSPSSSGSGPESYCDEFIKNMSYLCYFRSGTKITIQIQASPKDMEVEHGIEKVPSLGVLKFLFPTLSKLRDAGLRVEGLICATQINEHCEFSAEGWMEKIMGSGYL